MGRKKKEDLQSVIEKMEQNSVLTITDADGNIVGTVSAGELKAVIGGVPAETRENYYRRLLGGELSEEEIRSGADRYGIRNDAKGIVYLIELGHGNVQVSAEERISFVCETLRQIYSEEEKDTLVRLNDHAIALIHYLIGKKDTEMIAEDAEAIVSTINTELMETAKVAYGNVAADPAGLRQSYREARVAMEIAEVFSTERQIVSYAQLGIGRLIYELPNPLCEQFLEEVFGDRRGLKLKDEEIQTANKFFEKNLNLSEAARDLYIHRNTLVYHLEKLQKKTGLDIRNFDDALTLKIALMVKTYMEHRGRSDR